MPPHLLGPKADPNCPPALLAAAAASARARAHAHARAPCGVGGVEVMGAGDVARLQAFLEANPLYFQTVSGRPAEADEAQQLLDERPPGEMGWTGRWVLGYADAAATTQAPEPPLWAVLELVRDLLAPGVWHIALLIVATERHGQGDARRLLQGLRQGIAAAGGRWLRLGVVEGNARALRFWQRQGFVELRQRVSEVGGQQQLVRVMACPLGDGVADAAEDAGWVAAYLSAVPRDRPEALSPAGPG